MAQAKNDKLDALARGRLRTLLLYCPFDRKVTRHARRGNELRLVCLDCGRTVEHEPESESGATLDLSLAAPVATVPEPSVHGAPAPMGHLGGQAHSMTDRVQQMPRPYVLDRERRRPSASVVEPRGSGSPRRVRRSTGLTRYRLVLGAGAIGLLLLGIVNLFGQLTHGGAPAAQPPEVHVLTDGSGQVVTVANTEGLGVYLRNSPNMEDFLYPVGEGAQLQVVGLDLWADGIHWLPVEDSSGTRAWVPAAYTSLAS